MERAYRPGSTLLHLRLIEGGSGATLAGIVDHRGSDDFSDDPHLSNP
ncbi:MAG: hypothetical protein WBK88_08390 [Methanothrix sp.]